MPRKALELFSGTDSVGKVLRELGWTVESVDNGSEWDKGDPWGQPTHLMDVREFFRRFAPPGQHWNFGWASVPCHKFSVSVIGRNWNHDHTPKSQGAVEALELLRATVAYLMETCQFFLIENPSGKMIRIIEREFPSLTIYRTSWCQYRGKDEPLQSKKPTDLFGIMPPGFKVRPICKNGSPCHIAAPRQSQTGTQGMELKLKGMIPRALLLEIDASITSFDSFDEGAVVRLPEPVWSPPAPARQATLQGVL